MVRPDRHWCGAEVWRKGLHSYDQGEGLLLDRTVIPLGGSKLAAQVADWMFHSIHNLQQNCTQTSLGSIYRYRKRQIIIGWSQYWTGRQSRLQVHEGSIGRFRPFEGHILLNRAVKGKVRSAK